MTEEKHDYPMDENGLIILSDGRRFDPSTHSMRPGYLDVDGELMVIRKLGDNPHYYDEKTKTWVLFRDNVAALHSTRLTTEEAHKLAKGQGIPLDELV